MHLCPICNRRTRNVLDDDDDDDDDDDEMTYYTALYVLCRKLQIET